MNEITIFASDFHNSHSWKCALVFITSRLDSSWPAGIYTPCCRAHAGRVCMKNERKTGSTHLDCLMRFAGEL
jgi:hypothetical protein